MSELQKDKLLKYLRCVKNLEISLRSQKIALDMAQRKSNNCKRIMSVQKIPLKNIELKEYDNPLKMVLEKIVISVVLGGIMGIFAGIIKVMWNNNWIMIIWNFLFGPNPFSGEIFPKIKWGLAIGGIIGIIIGLLSLKSNRDEVDRENKRVLEKINDMNETIKRENEKNRQFAIKARNVLMVSDVEIDILKKTIAETEQLLQDFYGLNIIHLNYRNLVHICSIYEYFDIGLCDTLTGPYGAYNRLEDDIKYFRILEKLDEISKKLDDIKDNQRELYNAIIDTNNNIKLLDDQLNDISNRMDRGVQKLDTLNMSVADIEYNTKVTAECLQYTTLYNCFKN